MAKRGYKLQEFVAHSGNVNCLSFGKKNCLVFITGGDDNKVNLWSFGRPTPVMSLCGHTSPVESASFDSAEVLVVAGSSSGAIKLWDLGEAKAVRSHTGHRSYCTAVEFHPFGEFFASGSMDTNLKLWDIRKKGCIHTYKGHTRGISTIRFSPDGRWVVSGGFDNIVKVWDLTAGKLLHDFTFHEGHIRSIEFHPLEFLLATGSADKTVKFWDLETFEMIGSTKREATSLRSMTFHPDGRTLFCGLDDSLKVYSWEPVICHDSVGMGWSTLGGLCVHDGKLFGGAYNESMVGIWVADIANLELYGNRSCTQSQQHPKCDTEGSFLEKEDAVVSKSIPQSAIVDSDSKGIKTIYIDRISSMTSKTIHQVDVPEEQQPSVSEETSSLKNGPSARFLKQSNQAAGMAHQVDVIEDPSVSEETSGLGAKKNGPSERILIETDQAVGISSMKSETVHQFDVPEEQPSVSLESSSILGTQKNGHSASARFLEKSDRAAGISSTKSRTVQWVDLPQEHPSVSDETSSSFGTQKHGIRARLLEKSDRAAGISSMKSKAVHQVDLPEEHPSISDQTSSLGTQRHGLRARLLEKSRAGGISSSKRVHQVDLLEEQPSVSEETSSSLGAQKHAPAARFLGKSSDLSDKRSPVISSVSRTKVASSANASTSTISKPSHTRRLSGSRIDMHMMSSSLDSLHLDSQKASLGMKRVSSVSNTNLIKRTEKGKHSSNSKTIAADSDGSSSSSTEPSRVAALHGRTRRLVERFERKESNTPDATASADPVRPSPSQIPEPQIMTTEEEIDDTTLIESVMQNHEALLSTFQSRLTKLQVIRHFWGKNDIKGAVEAVKKLPDYSIQADVISVLIQKKEIITLELFACLLPMLEGLIASAVERHAVVSLEMLLRLVAVFGTVVRATVSAPRGVGVDLHAEQRLECCKQCASHLQRIQQALPKLMKRDGDVARYAQQLNLVLQQW